MLDNVGLRLESVSMNSYDDIISRMGLIRPKNSSIMNVQWFNMRLTYYPNIERLVLINSLHKLYNNIIERGYLGNTNDFHLADMDSLAYLLSDFCFERKPEDFKVTKLFEFGMNINTGCIKPFDIVRRWLTFKGNEFFASIPRKGKPIEKSAFQSDYRIKGYDKGLQSGLTGKNNSNILRYEIAVNQPRKVKHILGSNKVEHVTLKDISTHETWYKLYKNLLKNYDSIKKAPLLDCPVDKDDLFKLHGYISQLFSEDISQTMKKSSYNKWRASAKKIYDEYDSNQLNIHNLIRNKIVDKFIDLSN